MDVVAQLHILSIFTPGQRSVTDRMKIKTDMHASTRHGYPIHRQSQCPLMQNLKYEMITVIPCFVFALPNSPTPTTYKLIYAEIKREELCGKTYNFCHLF